jgi:glycerophosphoryl diester phosphodiesterase
VTRNKHAFADVEGLRAFLRRRPGQGPFVLAHRGAPQPGFPENCIATHEQAMACLPCFLEIDVRRTKDGLYVLCHDETLERCTTGKGQLADHTWVDLQGLFLRDVTGAVTPFQMPTLAEAIDWARGRTVLFVDVKRPVTRAEVLAFIRDHGAEAFCILMTYRVEDTLQYHHLAPNMVVYGKAVDHGSAEALLDSGVRADRLLVDVGDDVHAGTCVLLHRHGILVAYATCRWMDKKAAQEGLAAYYPCLAKDPDIITTDDVPRVAAAVREYAPAHKEAS